LRKIFTFITIALVISFSGCGTRDDSPDGEITITFWHSFISSTIPALNDLINKFEAENPGLKINAQYIPSGDALIQKLITAVQSETAPDISWLHSDFLEDLVKADAIYRMADFIEGKNGIPPEEIKDIYPALLQFASWKGTLYSIPMEATLSLIHI